MNIEDVAHNTPEKIITVQVDPAAGYSAYVGRRIASALKLEGDLTKQCVKMIGQLYKAFVEKDMSLLEINPLVVTNDDKLVCLDAKINFDSQRARPPPRDQGTARPLGRRPEGNRGLEVSISPTWRSTAPSAAW